MLRHRREALRAVARAQGELDAVLEDMAPRLRRRLRAIGFTPHEVEGILRQEFSRSLDARAEALERSIRGGAAAGVESDRAIAEAIFGRDNTPPFASAPAPVPNGSPKPRSRAAPL